MKQIEKGEYKLPEGCVAKVDNGILTIREGKRRIIKDERCRDCKHCGMGYSSAGIYWKSTVCFKQLKIQKQQRLDGEPIYRHVSPTGKICKNFDKR